LDAVKAFLLVKVDLLLWKPSSFPFVGKLETGKYIEPYSAVGKTRYKQKNANT
jgi:hypothetical protein